MFLLVLLPLLVSLASSSVLRRQDPGFQSIPTTGKADNTFNNGAPLLAAEPPTTNDIPPDIYGARSIDLPFYRLYHGNANYFSAGELNTPTGDQDQWVPQGTDSANQSACGIPDNAFSISKVAIHPYFLKFADLSRYCMQDVCISFWKEDGSSDMMLKVTDICSTDSNDPTYCATPADIKVDRTKVQIMEGSQAKLTGNQYPEQIWWFFMKCWDDGLAQPAYQGNNWFTEPALPNNLQWAQSTAMQQYQNNQQSYAAKWGSSATYPNGGYNTERDDKISPPISDWTPGQEPSWTPVAGGKGWGTPSASGGGSVQAAQSMGAQGTSSNTTQGSGQGAGQGAGQGGGQGGGQGSGQGGGQGGGQGAGQGSGQGSGQGGGQGGGQGAGQGSGQGGGQGSGQGASQTGVQSGSPTNLPSNTALSSLQSSTPSQSDDKDEQDDCDAEL